MQTQDAKSKEKNRNENMTLNDQHKEPGELKKPFSGCSSSVCSSEKSKQNLDQTVRSCFQNHSLLTRNLQPRSFEVVLAAAVFYG